MRARGSPRTRERRRPPRRGGPGTAPWSAQALPAASCRGAPFWPFARTRWRLAPSAGVPSPGGFPREDFGEMDRLHRVSDPRDQPADVQQAPEVPGGDVRRAGREDPLDLALRHLAGDLRILQGEDAPEAAAPVALLHLDELDSGDGTKQLPRGLDHPQPPPQVARVVVRHL